MASRVVMRYKVQDLRSSQMLRRRRRVLIYRRFGEIYRTHIQGSSSPKIKKLANDWLYRNVGNYGPTPHNIPEEQRSHTAAEAWHKATKFGLDVHTTVVGWPQDICTVARNMSLKNRVTPPGIDSGTIRLVAQRLNHYATPDPVNIGECLLLL